MRNSSGSKVSRHAYASRDSPPSHTRLGQKLDPRLFYWVIRNELEADPISLLKNISSGDKIIEESIKCAELYNDYKTMKYLEDLRLKPENNN